MATAMISGRINSGSLDDRSLIHSANGAWRSSTLSISTQYSARNTGICSSSGKQLDIGLTPSVLYRFIISRLSAWRSSL